MPPRSLFKKTWEGGSKVLDVKSQKKWWEPGKSGVEKEHGMWK